MEHGGLIEIANAAFGLVVLAMLLYYLKFHRTLDELSRRFLVAGFFFGIHELTFFLGSTFVYELTKTLFFITLFYSLMFVVRHNSSLNEKLAEQETFNAELKERLKDLKKEIT